jgi:outer membrane protein assembly factor BamB
MSHDNTRIPEDRLDADAAHQSEPDLPADAAETARYLDRLYAQQRREPDERFVQRLEQRLMSTSYRPLTAAKPHPNSSPWEHSRRTDLAPLRAPRHQRPSLLASVLSLAVLVALIAGAGFVAWRALSPGQSDPTPTVTLGQSSPTHAANGSPPPASDVIAWQRDLPAIQFADFGGMALADGLVYRLITIDAQLENDSFEGVEAIRADTGEIAWRYVSHWNRYRGLAADDAGVYFISSPDRIDALDANGGDPRWSRQLDERIISIALADGVLFAWDESNTMTAIDVTDGRVVWETASGDSTKPEATEDGYVLSLLQPAVGTTNVAIISANGALYAFDRKTGEVAWSTPGFDPVRSYVTVTDDVLFALTHAEPAPDEVKIPDEPMIGTGIDLDDGSVMWAMSVSGPLTQPVAPGGTEQFHLIADDVGPLPDASALGTPGNAPVGTEPTITPIVDSAAAGGIWPTHTAAPRDGASSDEQGSSVYGDPPGSDPGGDNVYGIDAQTGHVVWIRSSATGVGFALLATSSTSSEGIWALTYDGQVVRLAGEYGGFLGVPISVGLPITSVVVGSPEQGIIAEVRGGTLVAFGGRPSSEQG